MDEQTAMKWIVCEQHDENEENKRPVSEGLLRAVWKPSPGTKGIALTDEFSTEKPECSPR